MLVPVPAVEEFEADANRKPKKRPVGSSRRRKSKGTPSAADALEDDEEDEEYYGSRRVSSSVFDYDFLSDDDENAPVQRSLDASPAKGGSKPLVASSAMSATTAQCEPARTQPPPPSEDPYKPFAALTAATAAATAAAAYNPPARSTGLTLREAAMMHPTPSMVLDRKAAQPCPTPLAAAPARYVAAVQAEASAAAAARADPVAVQLRQPPPPPPLPPPPSSAGDSSSKLCAFALSDEPGARSSARRKSRADLEISGLSVAQLKDKIRQVAATRRERLHGAYA